MCNNLKTFSCGYTNKTGELAAFRGKLIHCFIFLYIFVVFISR